MNLFLQRRTRAALGLAAALALLSGCSTPQGPSAGQSPSESSTQAPAKTSSQSSSQGPSESPGQVNNSGLPTAPTPDASATGGSRVPCATAPVNGASSEVDCSASTAAYRVVAGGSNAAFPKAVCAPSEGKTAVNGQAACLQVNARPGDCIAAPDSPGSASRVAACTDTAAGGVVRVTRVHWDTKDEAVCGTGSVRYILSSPDHNGVLCMVDVS